MLLLQVPTNLESSRGALPRGEPERFDRAGEELFGPRVAAPPPLGRPLGSFLFEVAAKAAMFSSAFGIGGAIC